MISSNDIKTFNRLHEQLSELITNKTNLRVLETRQSEISHKFQFISTTMATDEKNMHEAYNVCPPASLPVQIESIACYGEYTTETRLKFITQIVSFCFVHR